ncbi:hypothetical protein JOF53_005993 [Crossiella equi]|uniref:DUF3060 domain-containing protein n=1 Tax=Crossiella equi TaxID=130796 RepID=A0ABS5AKM6_9PSEU|nr:hypothetical protein [Crossiella equi]MBP2477121.1 hypothetical protein [Crossiella equi]
MRSFTKRTVATVSATAVCAGLFLTAAPAMAATPTNSGGGVSTAAMVQDDDYDYEDATVEAVAKGSITLKLKTGAKVKLRVSDDCVVLKGGVRVSLADIKVGLKVRVGLAVNINILGIRIKIRGLAGLISIG